MLQLTAKKSQTKAKLRPLIPGDHGAYAMLLIPLAIGVIVGSIRFGVKFDFWLVMWLTLAMLAGFFSYEPLGLLGKPNINPAIRQQAILWLGIYGGIAVLSGSLLMLVWNRWALLVIGLAEIIPIAAYLFAAKARKQRSLFVRLAGIAGLVLSGPTAYYVVTAKLDGLALGLWAVGLLYFGSQLFYVRAWFEAKKQLKLGLPALSSQLLRAVVAFLTIGGAALTGLVVAGLLPWSVFLAFAPLAVKLAIALPNPPVNIPIKQIGLFEFAQSFVFALLLILALRQGN